MTTATYKGYTIRVTGLSHHIFRPENAPSVYDSVNLSSGYAQSMAAAKRWINADLAQRLTIPPYAHNFGK